MNLNSLSGMQQASQMLNLLALPPTRVATPGQPVEATGTTTDSGVDLAGEVSQLIHARLYYDANARVMETQGTMDQSLIDVQA